ncbi:hypothetical protein LSCM4_05083 [Leishmania orientalis]|uniref:Uncharacterized protein n=1 Tax=Leishmania orientalis TaxID=2249476 RepID=A0A836HE56_9TRYP|nr:hypothetical protein LSCM4_05083 [Leishmania orientalis]
MSHQKRPQLSLPVPDTLQVLDMGLDFRSYLSRVDESGVPILGNVISYGAAKVADVFEPTVGLLVTVLHLFSQSGSDSSATMWLKTYDTVQKVYLEQQEGHADTDGAKYAQVARDFIASQLNLVVPLDNRIITERLLAFLDYQSGIRGPQAPSQRKIPRDPKGAFCNLHLADHRCYQEFSCNQLHLHEAGPVRHRINFLQKLAEIMIAEGRPRAEVVKRVKDSIFFARYGNKVTVRCHNNWIPFFKTLYTDGRLEQAFRFSMYSCQNLNCTDEHCKGIHPQDRRVPPATKPIDLHNAQPVALELDEEAEHVVSAVEKAKAAPEVPPAVALASPISVLSPTAELWRNTVRDYVRQSGIPQVAADESLLRTLQDTKVTGTPLSTSERMTPLLEELDNYAFNSSQSSINSETRI